MKILLWSEFYPPYFGGIERATERLAIGLAERGHEISVITSHYDQPLPDTERSGKITIHRIPFHAALATGDLRSVAKALSATSSIKKLLRPDLIHLQLPAPSSLFHAQTLMTWTCPTLVTVHGSFKDCRVGEGTLLGSIFENASWLTAVSNAVLSEVLELAPGVADKSCCIYNGGEIVSDSTRSAIAHDPIIFSGGRMVNEKGFDLLLTAFQQVLRQKPTAQLVITGDGPERVNLQRDAEQLGIAARVTFPGWVSEEAQQLQMAQATVVVVPSRCREGFGLLLMEAALLGLPAIAADIGALAELVEDGHTGILVPPEDPAALCKAIVHFLDSPDLLLQLGNAARESAELRFSSAKMLEQYETLYRKLVLPFRPAVEGGLEHDATSS